MLQVVDAKILARHAPKTEISFSFDKGTINEIPYEERYKFEFLKLKNQSLEKGEFILDDTKVFPNEEEAKTIILIAVNSLIKFDICFLVDKEEKEKKVNEIKQKLFEVKDLPTTTNEEKNAKIAAIFSRIADILPSYILFNLNLDENKNNAELQQQLERIKDQILVIVLKQQDTEKVPEKEEEIEEEYITDISIGENTTSTTYKKEEYIVTKKKESHFFKQFAFMIKENIMVFLSFLIPTVGVVAFAMLSPLYGQTNNKVLLIPFIITIVVCSFLYLLMTYKCTSTYFDKEALKEKKLLIYFIINFIITSFGCGLGILIFILFKNFDTDLKGLTIPTLTYILGGVAYFILFTSCLYLGLIINKIKLLFKKK